VGLTLIKQTTLYQPKTMTIIHLTKTFSKSEDERIKSKDVFFDVEDVIWFRKTSFHSSNSMIDVHFNSGKIDSFHSNDWDKKSWERCISILESYFTEPIEAYPVEDQPSYLIH
jgi:hypothetical protein